MHGSLGEDGTVQGWLEKRGFKYTGSDSIASQKAFNKITAKEIAQDAGLRVARAIESHSGDFAVFTADLRVALERFNSIVIKPVLSGSSDGLVFAANADQLEYALSSIAARKPELYVIEERIVGTEITVGVVERVRDGKGGENVVLPCSEIRVDADATFDYAGKYLGKSREVTPAEISPENTARAQKIAKTIHEALGCRGYSRTDMIVTADDIVFLETNTLPGLTRMSFIPQQLREAKIDFQDFLKEQIQIAEGK